MKISLAWLKELVDCPWSAGEVAERLARAGLPVETMERLREDLAPIVVGEVLETRKHPNADRLTLCRVRVAEGGEPLSIVCGAPNVRAGLRVAVGLVGTTLPNGLTLEARKIRGEASQGMICSGEELACEPTPDAIWELPAEFPIGASLRSALGLDDVVFDIEVPSNRGDCLSHIGIAREVAAWSGAPVRLPEEYRTARAETITGTSSQAGGVPIVIEDAEGCPAYGAARIDGVRFGPSPAWLRARVERLGVRSLGNIVDATNLVLLECGHPIHAFDVARLRGPRVAIRRARPGEKLLTLDDKEHALAPSLLVIADAGGAIALAGIMGGKDSEVGPETTAILIEVALFDPAIVRAGSRLLRKTTEASLRFGRGADGEAIAGVLERASRLIIEVAGGELAGLPCLLRTSAPAPRRIDFAPKHARELLGIDLSDGDVQAHLSRAGCAVTPAGSPDAWTVVPPSYRRDLSEPVDLVEEIARHHGYENIPANETAVTRGAVRGEVEEIESRARETLAAAGFFEARPLSLVDPVELARLRLSSGELVSVENPLSSDQSALRPSLLAGLAGALRLNANRGNADVRLFEIGAVFRVAAPRSGGQGAASGAGATRIEESTGVTERRHLAIVWSGRRQPLAWDDAARLRKDAGEARADLFDLKGVLDALAEALRAPAIVASSPAAPHPLCHPARQAELWIARAGEDSGRATAEHGARAERNAAASTTAAPIGFIGEIDSEVAAAAELPPRTVVAEIDFDRLVAARAPRAMHKPLARFPAIRRDIALLVDDAVPEARVRDAIAHASDARLESLTLFDLYLGDPQHPLPPGKKSLAYALVFRSAEGTLTDAEADALRERAVTALEREVAAQIR